ncbi:MAG: glycosyltransferase family 2 protein [Hyphomonadaceae bacterium]
MRISICIPTFRRPDGFARAVRSVFAQVGLSEMAVELVAIDNSPEGSALSLLRRIADRAPIPMRVGHERRAGVAHARNAALALAKGDIIIWLDDDQEASPLWLDRLLAAHAKLKSDVVFGPIAAEAPQSKQRAYFERFFARSGPQEDVALEAPCGIGNSLMVRARLLNALAPFDAAANETGGEDDRLFAEAAARGLRFGWAHEAWVTEHVPPSRATANYALRRAFAYGQGPCETAAREGAHWQIARHMLVGAGQALVFGVSALFASLVRPPQSLPLWDRAARGAGKLFWFAEQKFYGAHTR